MHKYLHRFLSSPDATFQHIAVWTIVQLLESGGMCLYNNRFDLHWLILYRSSTYKQHSEFQYLDPQHQSVSHNTDNISCFVCRRYSSFAPLTAFVPRNGDKWWPRRNTALVSQNPWLCWSWPWRPCIYERPGIEHSTRVVGQQLAPRRTSAKHKGCV